MASDALARDAMQGIVEAVDALSPCWELDAQAKCGTFGCVTMQMVPPACVHQSTGICAPQLADELHVA